MLDNTFRIPIIPENEYERLKSLHSIENYKGFKEKGPFKHIASMASRMFNVPIALINFVDDTLVYSLSGVGLTNYAPVSRGTSLCSLAILESKVTVFENALEEPCLLSNPMVTGKFGLRFYAAAPLINKVDHNIGALCLIDKEARHFTELDKKILANLAAILMEEIQSGRRI